jgi:flagellar hook-associated protein 3 FlgL
MRVSENNMVQGAIQNIGDAEERLLALQNRTSSTKAFFAVSDNPGVVSQTITLRTSLQASEAYQSTAQTTDGWLTANDTAYAGLADLLTKAMTTLRKGLNDTYSDTERVNTFAPELQSELKNVVDIGNTTYLGKYIFSGYKITQQTYTIDDATNTITYNTAPAAGTTETMYRDLGPGQKIAINTTADQVIKPILDALTAARDAMAPTGGAAYDPATATAALTGLQNAMDNLSKYQTQNGVRMRQVSSFLDQMTATQTEIKSLLSDKEDANMAESIMLLQQQETVYKAVLEVGQRAISTLNLFDYLQ